MIPAYISVLMFLLAGACAYRAQDMSDSQAGQFANAAGMFALAGCVLIR